MTTEDPVVVTTEQPRDRRPPLDRRSRRVMWIGIVLAVIGLGALAATAAIRWGGRVNEWTFMARHKHESGVVETKSGLQYQVLKAAKAGPHPTDTDVALVNYEGKLLDGTTFDKSQQPTPMPVSAVVPGFSEALKLMPKGAKYRFWIPSNLGYGPTPPPGAPIPPNATLVFDVEMIDFLPESVVQQMQAQAQAQAGMPQGMPPTMPQPSEAPAQATPPGK